MAPIPTEPPFKAFLGGLPLDAVHADIETILRSIEMTDEEIRRCEIKMVRDRETDNFKGFAYVELPSREHLEKALTLRGVEFGGRLLKVDVASPPKGFDGSRGGRGGRGAPRGAGGRGRGDFGGRDFGGGRGGGGHWRGGEGEFQVVRGRGGRTGGPRRDSHNRNSVSESHDNDGEQQEKPVSTRPRLNLIPVSTDPADVEARRKADEEAEAKRRAKIFGLA